MAQIAFHTRLRARPGHRRQLVEVLRTVADVAATEPGTVVYAIHVDDSDTDVVWSYELFRDEEARRAHTAHATVVAALERLAELCPEPPEVVGGHPICGMVPAD